MGSRGVNLLSTLSLDPDDKAEVPVYEKYDALLHGSMRKRSDHILSSQFMRKYLQLAKCLKPKLTENACEVIANEYSRLRSQDSLDIDVARTQPVTARTLETLIRLSTAHAKARMGKQVTINDAHAAIELVQFAYFKKVLEKEKKKRRRDSGVSDVDDDDVDDDAMEVDGAVTPAVNGNSSNDRRAKKIRTDNTPDVFDYDSEDEALQPQIDSGDLTRRETREPGTSSAGSVPVVNGVNGHATETDSEVIMIANDRLEIFKSCVNKAFREARGQSLSLAKITEIVNSENANDQFSDGEIHSAVERMTDDNQIMVADGIVFLI